ncbi:MAG TPA: hypothetical protein VKR06_23770 [Ktedonosporobacter sp.]|nr:hypothetical protein [Ktedonosporobacter sp.]
MVQGKEFFLYLTRLTPEGATPTLLGMVFDSEARRWIHLDELLWDGVTKELSGFHTSSPHVPARAYIATLIGDDFTGSYKQEGTTFAWQTRRIWLEGAWASTLPLGTLALSSVYRWEAPLPVGTCDSWHAKFLRDGSWHVVDEVRVQGENVTIIGRQDQPRPMYLTARIVRDEMEGRIEGEQGKWYAKRIPDSVLL